MATEPSRLEANRLYWDTDASVGRIADTLGVSRRALYELLEPLAADVPCPACGSSLLFANRLARAAGHALCGTCGAEHRLAPSPAHRHEPAAPAPRPSRPTARARTLPASNGDSPAAETADNGAAAAGANGDSAGEEALPAAATSVTHACEPAPHSALERAAHVCGLADEREATLALARALRIFGFALVGVATGMAVASFLTRRRR